MHEERIIEFQSLLWGLSTIQSFATHLGYPSAHSHSRPACSCKDSLCNGLPERSSSSRSTRAGPGEASHELVHHHQRSFRLWRCGRTRGFELIYKVVHLLIELHMNTCMYTHPSSELLIGRGPPLPPAGAAADAPARAALRVQCTRCTSVFTYCRLCIL